MRKTIMGLKNGEDHIPPHQLYVWCILALMTVVIMWGMLDPSVFSRLAPTLFLCSLGLCLLLKGYHLYRDAFYVRYYVLGIKRRIPWERVRHIEYVSRGVYRYLFIALDDCPSFHESNQYTQNYIVSHPFKLIAIDVPEKRATAYIQLFEKYYPKVERVE